MGYWMPGMGFMPFVRKYLSIIIAVAALVVLVGALSGYTTYIITTGRAVAVNETFNETLCSVNLANCIQTLSGCRSNLTACISTENATEQVYSKCKYDLEQMSLFANDLQTTLAAYKQSNTNLQDQLTNYRDKVNEYLEQIARLELNMTAARTSMAELNATVAGLNTSLTSLQAEQGSIITNAAKNICCTQKIYNPSLQYYYVDNSTIKCTTAANATLGTKEFSCF